MSSQESRGKGLKRFYSLTDALAWIAYVALSAIVVTTFVDVIGRYFLNKPIRGSYELVLLFMTVFGGFAMMYCAVNRGHIAIDLITGRFPRRVWTAMQSVISFLGFGVWAVLSGQVALRAVQAGSKETTDLLRITTAPFRWVLAFAVLLFSLVLLVQTFERKPEKKEGEIKE